MLSYPTLSRKRADKSCRFRAANEERVARSDGNVAVRVASILQERDDGAILHGVGTIELDHEELDLQLREIERPDDFEPARTARGARSQW